MFLTKEQAEKRLSSENNLANRFNSSQVEITEKVIQLPGKKPGSINLEKEVRNEIAIRARLGETQVSLAKEFKVITPTVSSIERGKVKGIDEDKVEKAINEVRDRALDRLMHSLGLITDDKLSGCSAKDLSVIASNMGRVVEKVTPKTEGPDNINFIIYSPELKKEQAFDVVEI